MRQNVKDLSTSFVDAKPVDFDFGQGYPEEWEFFEADECSECGEGFIARGEAEHCDEGDSACKGYVNCDGPIMNYFYPVDVDQVGGAEKAAKAVAHLPLCIVSFSEDSPLRQEYALALTGGGMDLSWQICEAYMCLGYLPPLHFALPNMAGMKLDARNKWILSGVERSASIAKGWATRSVQRVRQLRKTLKGVTA